jgi:cyanophycin synthetase
MLVMTLDLEGLAAVESCAVAGFVDRLIARLPGLTDHHCAAGRPGGFIERLREGTYFGHIVEHVALELSDAARIPVNRGKTVATDVPGRYLVAVAYKSERGMTCLLRTAVEFVQALIDDVPYPLDDRLQEARDLVAKYELGPSTRAVVDAAARRGIPWSRVNEDSLVRLGHGRGIRHIEATLTDRTSTIAVDLAANKHETKRLLAGAGLPVPQGCVVSSREEAMACASKGALPAVVKPLDGNQGRGVSLNLSTAEQVAEAFDLASEVSSRAIVEEMYRGNDYRIVIVDGRMVAAAQRIPAHVWGDGVHSIRELIDFVNHDPRRGNGHEKPLTKITADPLVLAILKRHGRSLDDVPERGQMVLLRESANLSTGGEARDVTDRVHATIRSLCQRAARIIGLDVCGVDLVLQDIDRPFAGEGGIVEVNAAPGIRMHHHPSEGTPRDVGGAIVEMLYPDGATGRIPIVSITGTNGKTTVARMIRHALAATGKTIGMTTTDGVWIGDDEVARGDLTGPWAAGLVLADPSVEVAVFETARGGIVRSGLGYDWADIAVMTNIQADHIGQDGIDSIADIARIKRLVAERVRPGGTLILNADDPELVQMAAHPRVLEVPKDIVFYSMQADSPIVARHTAAGGSAIVAADGWIEERRGEAVSPIVAIDAVPATLAGSAEFQVYNVVAALAALRAYGLDAPTAAAALTRFDLARHSAGRVNLFALRGGYVMVDYGHNPAALEAVCRTVARWGAAHVSVVMAVPGDRRDSLIADAGRAVSCVDRVIIHEDEDLRGRRPGEVAGILAAALREERPELPISIIPSSVDAVADAVESMAANRVVLAMTEDVEAISTWLVEQGATPVSTMRPFSAAAPDAEQPAA